MDALSPSGGQWTLNVLYNFQGGQDGSSPYAQLALGPKGSAYGFSTGGTYGTVFQLLLPAVTGDPCSFQILYVCSGRADGNLEFVYSPLIRSGGALYGIASGGSFARGRAGCGSVVRMTPPASGTAEWS